MKERRKGKKEKSKKERNIEKETNNERKIFF